MVASFFHRWWRSPGPHCCVAESQRRAHFDQTAAVQFISEPNILVPYCRLSFHFNCLTLDKAKTKVIGEILEYRRDEQGTMDKKTDLTTLTGPDGEYAPLVKACFTDEECGNTTLKELNNFTLDTFLDNFGKGKPTFVSKLRAWLEYYDLKGEFEEDQKQASQGPRGEAYFVRFTVLRDNRQADGLRKLITIAASKNGAFYTSPDNGETTQELHNAAFASESTPDDFDLSPWPPHEDAEACPRLLSVSLYFRSYEKIGTFEDQVVELLESRPSAMLVDKRAKTVLHDAGKVCNISEVAPIRMPRHVLSTHYVARQSPFRPSPANRSTQKTSVIRRFPFQHPCRRA